MFNGSIGLLCISLLSGRILEMSKGEMFIGNICIQDNMLYFLASDYFLKEYVSSDLQLDNDIFVLKIKL